MIRLLQVLGIIDSLWSFILYINQCDTITMQSFSTGVIAIKNHKNAYDLLQLVFSVLKLRNEVEITLRTSLNQGCNFFATLY